MLRTGTASDRYPRDLWRCVRCRGVFALDDNGQFPRHIERTSNAWCTSLQADVRVYQGKR